MPCVDCTQLVSVVKVCGHAHTGDVGLTVNMGEYMTESESDDLQLSNVTCLMVFVFVRVCVCGWVGVHPQSYSNLNWGKCLNNDV